jgi:iron complex outermembrane receptor protein
MHPLVLAVLLAAAPDTTVVPMPEVVVIGNRVRESALRAPAAVSVVRRDAFATGRDISLDDALALVPGVFVQSRGGAQDVRVTIRGYGARGNGDRSNAGNMRGIRVLTDGIPVSEPDGRTSLDLVDLGSVDRVEVSRSNASALYGNASGGVIDLRARLDFDTPFARFEQRAGSFGFHREQGVVGWVAGRGRGTMTLATSAFGGWRDHSESFTSAFHTRFAVPLTEDGSRLVVLADAVSNLNRFPGALTSGEFAADPRRANPVYVTRDERRFNRVGRLAASLEHAPSPTQDLSVAAWVEPKVLQRSERDRFRDFTRFHVGANAVWSWAHRLGDGVTGRLSVGGDEALQDGAILFYDLAPGGTRGTTVRANKREGANSAGAFVQQQVDFATRWSAQLALRHDALRYISEDRISPRLDASRHFRQWTPKATLSWRGDATTVYGSLGGGVEAPAFNEIDPPAPFDTATSLNPFLEPMTSTTCELGVRGARQTRAGFVRYDLAAYWIDVRDEVVPFNGGAYFFTAGRSRRRGLEAALDWTPVERLTLRGSATLSRNTYVEYRNELGDFAGNEVPGLPAVQFAAQGVGRLAGGVSVRLGVEGASRYFAEDANTERTFGYGLLAAGLDWRGIVGGRTLRVFVTGDNLLDKTHVASVFINGVSGRYFEPGLPRSVTAGLTLSR